MADPQRRINTVKRAAELFRTTPGRHGMVIELDGSAEEVLVAGDLHGNLAHFQALLDCARLDRNPRRHLVLQELVHGLDRYPNGGCKSHQLVDLVSALKCQYPERVHLILGNHELAEVLARPIIKAGVRTNELFRRGIEAAYQQHQDEMYATYLDLFRALPLAVRTGNRVFISHSFPEGDELLSERFDLTILSAQCFDEISQQRTSSLYELVWGRDSDEQNARRFASLVDADILVVGHMPCQKGFANPNPVQLILDSSHFPACYCLFSSQHPITMSEMLSGVHML